MARLRYAGLMAHLLHIRPWEADRLTVEEMDAAIQWCERHRQAVEKGVKP